jgi:Cu(I)/Ag(I) efflux system membrane fusion protein
MKLKPLVLLTSGLLLIVGGYGIRRTRAAHPGREHAAHAAGYHCPMHPTFKSDKPGSCPICSMTLVSDEAEEQAASAGAASAKKICVLHHCTMAGCVMELMAEAGQKVTCPICGVAEAAEVSTTTALYYRNPMHPEVTSPTPKKDDMGMDYVPVYAEPGAASTVSGQGNIVLSEERRQMIGMKSVPVERRDLAVVVRASGSVAYDPDLYQAITEYREAAKARDAVKDSPWPDVHERSDALVRASELRLRQIGLSEKQISEIMKSSATPTNLLFGGSGGTVWVYAQIYEYEIGLVRQGQQVEITTPAYPGRKFHGVVKAVDPNLSAETRSLKARIEVPNPDDALKLEMYVDTVIKADMGRKLALPTDALVDTGVRKLVYIDLGNGRIEPREVQIGREADGFYEVLSGIREGEKAVTSANFLIDSESKLKAITPKTQEIPQPEHRH